VDFRLVVGTGIICPGHRKAGFYQDEATKHYNQGNAYARQGKYDQAIASYQKAIAIKSNVALVHNNLGVTYANQGKLDEAIAAYKKAIEINSNYGDGHRNLGIVYRRQSKYDLAIASHQKAIARAHFLVGGGGE
jgi:superkiller protein 3